MLEIICFSRERDTIHVHGRHGCTNIPTLVHIYVTRTANSSFYRKNYFVSHRRESSEILNRFVNYMFFDRLYLLVLFFFFFHIKSILATLLFSIEEITDCIYHMYTYTSIVVDNYYN